MRLKPTEVAKLLGAAFVQMKATEPIAKGQPVRLDNIRGSHVVPVPTSHHYSVIGVALHDARAEELVEIRLDGGTSAEENFVDPKDVMRRLGSAIGEIDKEAKGR